MNAINWFEIVVTDIERSTVFYQTVLATELKREVFERNETAMFTAPEGAVAGCLVKNPLLKAGPGGAVVYLNTNGKLDDVLARVGKAGSGGKIVMPKTDIGAPGFIAMINDPDGNLVGLHSEK